MKVCGKCGTVAEPKRFTPGSILIEIVLWLCFLVPGLIYSLWRLSKRRDVCPSCGADELLQLDSPRGRAVATESGYTPPTEAYRPPSAAAQSFGRSLGVVVRRAGGGRSMLVAGLLAAIAVVAFNSSSMNSSGWEQVATVGDLHIAVVQKKFAGQKYVFEKAARDACGNQSMCRVGLWVEGDDVPKALPMTDQQLQSKVGSYTRDRSIGTDKMLWRCGAFHGEDSGDCFKG